jgi:hypothetical protein
MYENGTLPEQTAVQNKDTKKGDGKNSAQATSALLWRLIAGALGLVVKTTEQL